MHRFMVGLMLVLVLAALVPAAAAAAPPPGTNQNAGEVDFTCEDGNIVTVWVNFVGSEAGENPALVVTGSDAQVFKLVSYQVGADTPVYYTRFSAPPAFDLVQCTHPLELDGENLVVTLTGVFIP